jgi:four helix bundle protein
MASINMRAGHRDLVVWQKAMRLVTEVYRVTSAFPKHELYGLVGQIRRAAVSVPSNVAEGYARNSRNELHHFIGQARGSLAELETQIEIAKNLGYVEGPVASDVLTKTSEVGRMLTGLRTWCAQKP